MEIWTVVTIFTLICCSAGIVGIMEACRNVPQYCSFEQIPFLSFCGWTADAGWTLNRLSRYSYNYVAMLDGDQPEARLTSEVMCSTRGSLFCLTFWYQFQRANTHELSVRLKDGGSRLSTLWTLSSSIGWAYAQVPIRTDCDFHIMFEARSKGDDSDENEYNVLIDTVRYENSSCPLYPLSALPAHTVITALHPTTKTPLCSVSSTGTVRSSASPPTPQPVTVSGTSSRAVTSASVRTAGSHVSVTETILVRGPNSDQPLTTQTRSSAGNAPPSTGPLDTAASSADVVVVIGAVVPAAVVTVVLGVACFTLIRGKRLQCWKMCISKDHIRERCRPNTSTDSSTNIMSCHRNGSRTEDIDQTDHGYDNHLVDSMPRQSWADYYSVEGDNPEAATKTSSAAHHSVCGRTPTTTASKEADDTEDSFYQPAEPSVDWTVDKSHYSDYNHISLNTKGTGSPDLGSTSNIKPTGHHYDHLGFTNVRTPSAGDGAEGLHKAADQDSDIQEQHRSAAVYHILGEDPTSQVRGQATSGHTKTIFGPGQPGTGALSTGQSGTTSYDVLRIARRDDVLSGRDTKDVCAAYDHLSQGGGVLYSTVRRDGGQQVIDSTYSTTSYTT